MAKAVFLDYTGTILQEGGEDIEEMISRCTRHSKAKSGEQLLSWWWKNLRELEESCYLENYRTEEEICLILLKKAEKEWGLRENLDDLVRLNKNYWMNAPMFSDVQEFFRQCPLPIYIITNNSDRYVRIFLKRNNLHVNGIICGDMVKAYKPHPEIFLKALEVSGCRPEEVVHIGDSLRADVQAAGEAGIIPVYLNRSKKQTETDCRVVYSLREALRYL